MVYARKLIYWQVEVQLYGMFDLMQPVVSRGIIVQAIGVDRVTPREKVFASAIAGSIGGAAGGLLRM